MTSDALPRIRGHWLTAEQLAAELQISPRHLIRLREAGLPCVQLGAVVRFNADEVEAYLREHRRLAAEGGSRQ